MFPPSSPFAWPSSSDRTPRRAWTGGPEGSVQLAPTPRSVVWRDGPAELYRFARPANDGEDATNERGRRGQTGATGIDERLPVLIVPSLINRWYILDLRAGKSFVEAMVRADLDTFCLDWGVPADEDRYTSWEDVANRLHRAVRRVLRVTGAPRLGLIGYCMGGTLSAIYTALEPQNVAALVNLAGPVDFSESGPLGELVDSRFFDPDAIADAGNVSPVQMQSGFQALRPTLGLSKIAGMMDRVADPEARAAFSALETWSNDNVPFPGDAYRTYIRELYQENALCRGHHRVGGRLASLASITCPILAIVAERDTICPPPAATALTRQSGSTDCEVLSAPGGHVGAVVGRRASEKLYPATTAWLRDRLRRGPRPA